jgi:DNA processing protein
MISENIEDIGLWVALQKVPHLSALDYIHLLQHLGSPEKIFQASIHTLKQVVSNELALLIHEGPDKETMEQVQEWLKYDENDIICLADSRYPKSLLEIYAPPPLLYLKGNLDCLHQPIISIIGTDTPSARGIKIAADYALELSHAGFSVLSTFNKGISASVMEGVMLASNHKPIAIFGHGLDSIYPKEHKALAYQILKQGLIMSEFPLTSKITPQSLLSQRKLICGLALGCLVIEAKVRSEEIEIAKMASEHGLDVFAIPGPIESAVSRGCHYLIKQGAKLVDSIEDITQEMNYKKT